MENAMTDKKIIYDAINSAEDRGLDHDAMITEMAADLAVREFVIRMLVEQVVFHVQEEIAAIDRGLGVLDRDPPQELDHSGWPKHIRDTIRSPANPRDDARMHASKLEKALL